jgi:hypothetical protein
MSASGMQTTQPDRCSQAATESIYCHMSELSQHCKTSTDHRKQRLYLFVGILLALLPVVSFLGQYVLSVQAGTQKFLLHHLAVTVADWIFVPFNFLVVQVIEWRRGLRLYLIACVSVGLNALAHAFWQYNGLDAGHMITKAGIILPAGWVHLSFSILEMILLVAFVFCRKADAQRIRVLTVLATVYFLILCLYGYVQHQSFLIRDVVILVCQLFFVILYPQLIGRNKLLYKVKLGR